MSAKKRRSQLSEAEQASQDARNGHPVSFAQLFEEADFKGKHLSLPFSYLPKLFLPSLSILFVSRCCIEQIIRILGIRYRLTMCLFGPSKFYKILQCPQKTQAFPSNLAAQ